MNYSYKTTVMASEPEVSEFIKVEKQESCKVTQININKNASRILSKPAGNYTVLDFDCHAFDVRKIKNVIYSIIESYYSKLDCSNILIAALGNEYILADSFGCLVIDKLNDRLPSATKPSGIFRIKTQVEGTCGIKSSRLLKAAARLVKPQLVILLDSMIADSEETLLSSVQVSDSAFESITSENKLQNFSKHCHIISIGYTTTITSYSSSMTDKKDPVKKAGFLYAPLECGFYIMQMADIVADCLNLILTGKQIK